MNVYSNLHAVLVFLVACVGANAVFNTAAAQGVSLNYDRLSSLEEPLALELADVTLRLNGLVDTPVSFGLDGDGNDDEGFIGNFHVSAATQLPNRWRVNLAYFGQYTTDPEMAVDMGENYQDNVALSVGGAWGTVLGGNLSGIVREQTRRLRGAGNAFLAFDDAFGGLENWGGGYVGRFGPVVMSAVVDEESNFDLGAMFQRPLGTRDYRFTARYTQGTYTPEHTTYRYETKGAGLVGELVYGSMLFDIGAGYEHFSATLPLVPDTMQWYVSSGAHLKIRMLTLSVEGHYGQLDGEDKISAALGLRYDVARGLSANLGLNHEDARADVGHLNFIDTKDTRAVLSMRYSF